MAHNLALVLTLLVFWVGVKVHKWWEANHSPTDGPKPIGGVKPQVGDGLTPVDPTSGAAAGKRKTILRPDAAMNTWLSEHGGARRTNELIREAARRFGVSVSTVKRRLRRLREGGPQ